MKCVTMVYPNKQDAKFDFDYYLKKHIPWARKLSGDRGTQVRRGISTPGNGAVPYVCVCRFWIESEEQYRAAMAQHGKELIADIRNFTNIEPVVQVDEVLLETGLAAAA